MTEQVTEQMTFETAIRAAKAAQGKLSKVDVKAAEEEKMAVELTETITQLALGNLEETQECNMITVSKQRAKHVAKAKSIRDKAGEHADELRSAVDFLVGERDRLCAPYEPELDIEVDGAEDEVEAA